MGHRGVSVGNLVLGGVVDAAAVNDDDGGAGLVQAARLGSQVAPEAHRLRRDWLERGIFREQGKETGPDGGVGGEDVDKGARGIGHAVLRR